MKKFFLLAAMVGVALTGCMKNEVYVPKCDTPISFEVANYVAQTRANGAFAYDSFGVNAWSHDTDSGTVAFMMDDEDVSLIGGKWTTTTPYYWPIKGTVDFIAYYPTSVEPTIVYDYAGADTYTYTNYTVEAYPNGVDLMYADKAIRFSANKTATENESATLPGFGITGYGFEGVPTLFHHALAKINFVVKNQQPTHGHTTYEIVVDEIKLNTYNTGKVTLTNDGTIADASRGTWNLPTNNVWTHDTTGGTVELKWEDPTNLTTATEHDYAPRTEYVLPQILSDDVTLSVKYTVTQKSDGAFVSKKTYTPDPIKVKDMGLARWEMNKNITYTITISVANNQILFAPAVQEWEAASGNVAI